MYTVCYTYTTEEDSGIDCHVAGMTRDRDSVFLLAAFVSAIGDARTCSIHRYGNQEGMWMIRKFSDVVYAIDSDSDLNRDWEEIELPSIRANACRPEAVIGTDIYIDKKFDSQYPGVRLKLESWGESCHISE